LQKRVIAKELAILAARMSWIIASRIALVTAFGVVLNAVLLFFDRHAVWAYFSLSGPSMPVARAGGIGAVIALAVILFYSVIENPVFFGIVLAFCVGFPLAHFLAGKKLAVSTALAFALRNEQAVLAGYLVERMLMAAERHPQWQQWIAEGGLPNALDRFLPPYLRKLGNMPMPLRLAMRLLLTKFDFIPDFSREIRNFRIAQTDPERISGAVAELFERHVSEKRFRPSTSGVWILTATNVLFAVLVAVGARLL
jgi:hypothetical protein